MMKLSIALLAAMSLAGPGCHKNTGGDAIAKLTALKDKMCACRDRTCSDKVSEELAQWGQEQEKSGDQPASLSEKDNEKVEALKEETASCLLKLEVPGSAGAAGPSGAAGSAGAADGAMDRETPAAAPAAGSAAAGSAH